MPSAFGNKVEKFFAQRDGALGDHMQEQSTEYAGGDGVDTNAGYSQGVGGITSGMQNTNLNSGAGYNDTSNLGNTTAGYNQGGLGSANTIYSSSLGGTGAAGYGTQPTAADKAENAVDNMVPGGEHHTKSGATNKNTGGIGGKVENLIHKLIPGGDKGNNTTTDNTSATGLAGTGPGAGAQDVMINNSMAGGALSSDVGFGSSGGQYGGLPVGGSLPMDKSNMVCVPGNVAAPVPVGKKVFTVAEDHAMEKERVERWVEHRPVERDYVTRVEATGNIAEQGVYADSARAREAIVAEREVAPHPTGQTFFQVPEDHAVEKERVERWTEHRPVEREFLTRVEATGNVTEQGAYADNGRAREAVVAERAVETHPTGQKFFSVAEDHATEKERVDRWVEHRPVERDYVTRVEATGVITEEGVYADSAKAKERVLAESTCFPVGATTTEGVQGMTASGPHVVGVDAQAAPV